MRAPPWRCLGPFYGTELSVATCPQVRGQLLGDVQPAAKQELVCVAVSDSIWNVGYQSPSATPVMTQVAPILS